MTPVYKKPEFWVTVVTSVAGLLMAFGVISKDQADIVSDVTPKIIGGIMTIVSSVRFVAEQNKARIAVFNAMCATGHAASQSSVSGTVFAAIDEAGL